MNWAQLAGSIAAILALAGVARWLRLGESRIGSPAEAREIAEDMLAGFYAHAALVSQDGGAAIVAGNGAIAVLKRHGAQVAARRLLAPLTLGPAVEGVTVRTGERLFGDVTLLGVLETDVRGLEASLTRV
ncbi:MAG: hypothetical protein P0Y59_19070 [Candidatus Sphingomonas phytovorans]|nr:hypothetical protein [Sphingomonas sp.]WEJ99022.1 MAG: hypothetical protein P0Y59_19070 [Sphingomonas sp.]